MVMNSYYFSNKTFIEIINQRKAAIMISAAVLVIVSVRARKARQASEIFLHLGVDAVIIDVVRGTRLINDKLSIEVPVARINIVKRAQRPQT